MTRIDEASQLGIMPRAVNQIFETIKAKQEEDPECSFTLRVSFLEIYCETVRDLLSSNPKPSMVAIRQNEAGEILVMGSIEEAVKSESECFALLERGTVNRTTGSTLMNEMSSRSHAIFTIYIEHRYQEEGTGVMKSFTSKLNMVIYKGCICVVFESSYFRTIVTWNVCFVFSVSA